MPTLTAPGLTPSALSATARAPPHRYHGPDMNHLAWMVAAWALTTLTALGRESVFERHPQDGPHADLRIWIEDDHVRFNIGVNLALIDHAFTLFRESPDAVSPSEADAINAAWRRWLEERVRVEIDGVAIAPRIDFQELFTDPDPGMVALFPLTGTRALIRMVCIADYPAASPPSEVAITWPVYPPDQLAEVMEAPNRAQGEPVPPMYFEVQLRAQGKLAQGRFTQAEPTLRWSRDGGDRADTLAGLPAVPEPSRPLELPVFAAAGAGLGGVCLLGSVLPATRRRGRSGPWLIAAAVSLSLGLLLRDSAALPIPGTSAPPRPIEPGVAAEIFTPLHEHVYRAFDYTDESDRYDALARAVDGPLLETLYNQTFDQLLQAEEEGMLGVVTGIDRLELTTRPAPPSAQGPAFSVLHRWRVRGTVYHWGHSHTRGHEYQAEYTVAAREAGWRIVDQRILSQTRLDDDGNPADASSPDAASIDPSPSARELIRQKRLRGDDY